jgi:hypothetical protein
MEFPNLRLKKMSGRRNVTDSKKFVEIAADFGMDSEQLLEHVSIPLSKIAKGIGDKADRGQKQARASEFMDRCSEEGIIEQSPARHTLS